MRKPYFLLAAFLCLLPAMGQNLTSLLDSVVKITSKAEGGVPRTGTGFIVATEGDSVYIATASHVIEGDSAPKVEFRTQLNRQYPASVGKTQGGDAKGFAYLIVRDRTVAAKVKALRWSGEDLQPGDDVRVIGFGQGQQDWGVTKGDVANVGADIIINGPIEDGNSGGPIIRNGGVAGMITSARQNRGIGKPSIFVTATLRGWRVPLLVGPPATPETPAQQGGLPAGYGMRECGCWGPNPPSLAVEPRCASGNVRINVCPGVCAPGHPSYAWVCASIEEVQRANSAQPLGLPSGHGMRECGCWGANPHPTAAEPRCASGSVRVNVCPGFCAPGHPRYAWVCS
jgi:hypothetical protein